MISKKAFTIIELLVVIAIVGLLASIVLSATQTSRKKSADASVQTMLLNARNKAMLYYSSNNNSYMGVCLAAVSAGGIKEILDAVVVTSGATGRLDNTLVAGAFDRVSCHPSATNWAAEAPLNGSTLANPLMWCVDSTGVSKKLVNNKLGAGAATCP